MLLPVALCLLATTAAHSHSLTTAQPRTLQHNPRSLCARSLTCHLAHESTEGPYYIPHPLLRSNITEDRAGVPLTLNIHVVDVNTCEPVQGVYVDIWHADAMGQYSGWADHADAGASETATHETPPPHPADPSQARPPGKGSPPPHRPPFESSRWLRGVQKTTRAGNASFATIVPGWYAGRCTHMHIRIHAGGANTSDGVLLDEGRTAHTGQLYLSDAVVRRVWATAQPYAARGGAGPLWNGEDGIFTGDGGAEQIIDVRGGVGEGFEGWVVVGVEPAGDHTGEELGPPGREGGPRGGMVGVVVMAVAGGLGVVGLAVVGWRYWVRRRDAQGRIALK